MKKFFAGIAAAAIITVPMTSFALESMSKGALKKATGQAGVSIGLDNIVIYMSSQPTTTYWDNDGTSTGFSLETAHNSGATSVGSTAFSNVGHIDRAGLQISYNNNAEKLITIGAILDGETYGAAKMKETFGVSAGIADSSTSTLVDVTNGNAIKSKADAAGYIPTNNTFVSGISPLTIDVGTCQALTQGLIYNKMITGVAPYTTALNGALTTAATTSGSDYANALAAYKANPTTANKDALALATAGVLDTALSSSVTDATARGKLVGAFMTVSNVDAEGVISPKMETNANIVGVVIGLPTVELNTYHTKDSKTLKVVVTGDVSATSETVANAGCQFIEIEKSGNSKMAILGGRLEIAPH